MAGKKLTFGIIHPKDCKCWLCRGEARKKQMGDTEPTVYLVNEEEDKKDKKDEQVHSS